ncbi:MAG: hypothetical protein OXC48_10645 [Endozoicomonadaceae bacterium]|nr:hypothetical protein [Endozoicomonadaceae bacterium]
MKKQHLAAFLIIFLISVFHFSNTHANLCSLCRCSTDNPDQSSDTTTNACSCQMTEAKETPADNQQTESVHSSDNNTTDDISLLSQQINALHLANSESDLTVSNPLFAEQDDGSLVAVEINDNTDQQRVCVTRNTTETTPQTLLVCSGAGSDIADHQAAGTEDTTDHPDNLANTCLLVISHSPAKTEEQILHNQMLVNGKNLAVIQMEMAQLRGPDRNNPKTKVSQNLALKSTRSIQKKELQKQQNPPALPRRALFVYHKDSYAVESRFFNIDYGKTAWMVKSRVQVTKKNATKTMVKLELQHFGKISSADQNNSITRCNDDTVQAQFYHENIKNPGYVVFSKDKSITKTMQVSLENLEKLNQNKGNNSLFQIFYEKKLYMAKKELYRLTNINIQSKLTHTNILELQWVLMGEESKRYRGNYYSFYFFEPIGLSLRMVINNGIRDLKNAYDASTGQADTSTINHLNPEDWLLIKCNFKHIIKSVLLALKYLHNEEIVHRTVAASHILLKTTHQCSVSDPLYCPHKEKYLVKLGGFDHASYTPGHNFAKTPTHIIKYASVMPFGAIQYRAPEVGCPCVMSGPIEIIYDCKADIWSFGCLLYKLIVGERRTLPLAQRHWACLLLSQQYASVGANNKAKECFKKGVDIDYLKKNFTNEPQLVEIVEKCLQVDFTRRPTATDLLQEQWFQDE